MKALRIISIVLLALNEIGAIIGSLPMIIDPSGKWIGMKPEWLEGPFNNYLVPGIVLLVFIGCFSLVTMILILLKKSVYPLFLIAEGFFLSIWICIQMSFFTKNSWMQPTWFIIGIGFLALGYLQRQIK